MNIKQAIKNIFSKLFTSSKPKEIPPIETMLTKTSRVVGKDKPSVDGHINALAEYPNVPPVRDPMVKVYQDVRTGLGLQKVSDQEATAQLVRFQKCEAVRTFHDPELNDGFNDRLSDIGKDMGDSVAENQTGTPESLLYDTGFDDSPLEIGKYLTDPVEATPQKVQNSTVSGADMRGRAQMLMVKNDELRRLAIPVEAPLQKPSFISRPTKKLNRAEKKQLKFQQQQANLALQRGKASTPEKKQVVDHTEAPMDLSFAAAVVQNNITITSMIDDLEAGEFKPVVRHSPPGVIVPEVSDIMGDEYGPRHQWTHKDDQFIDFKILTRIVVSDPLFFSKYVLRTLEPEELTQYPANYYECFVAIEELYPVADLNAMAIMDKEHYCILVAFQNVFGMLVVNEDDAIDIKRRSAGFDEPHATGYYHMTFMRFDHEALIHMDLVGRTEHGYAEQIPSFKVNFAKFDHTVPE